MLEAPTDRPFGEPVKPATAVAPHGDVELVGQYVTLTGIRHEHGNDLYREICGKNNASLWDYIPLEPWMSEDEWKEALSALTCSEDPTIYTILIHGDAGNKLQTLSSTSITKTPGGICSLNKMDIPNRVVEVGMVYGGQLARSRAATEAMYLLARHAFEDLHFRRYEWRANKLHAASDRAARRLGFQFEGTLRQHMIVRGRNRDTIVFSMLDSDWPSRKEAFEQWLAHDNFGEDGKQKRKLEEFRD